MTKFARHLLAPRPAHHQSAHRARYPPRFRQSRSRPTCARANSRRPRASRPPASAPGRAARGDPPQTTLAGTTARAGARCGPCRPRWAAPQHQRHRGRHPGARRRARSRSRPRGRRDRRARPPRASRSPSAPSRSETCPSRPRGPASQARTVSRGPSPRGSHRARAVPYRSSPSLSARRPPAGAPANSVAVRRRGWWPWGLRPCRRAARESARRAARASARRAARAWTAAAGGCRPRGAPSAAPCSHTLGLPTTSSSSSCHSCDGLHHLRRRHRPSRPRSFQEGTAVLRRAAEAARASPCGHGHHGWRAALRCRRSSGYAGRSGCACAVS